jgi:DNA-binding transcriptional LysR family regulator
MSTNKALTLLHEMAVFVKVVELGSFSEAARELNTTPSAISRAVARLEKALHTRLLQRSTRKLRLSDSGTEIYQHCRAMASAAHNVMEAGQAFSQAPEGTLRISAPRAFGRFKIHTHIADFLTQYPHIDVVLRLEDHHVDLISEHVDLAIRITDAPPPGLMGRRLMKVEHLLCATPAYLKAHGTPQHPDDLKMHSCIALSEAAIDARWKFQKEHHTTSVDVKGRYTVNHSGLRLEAVQQHLGIGGVPDFIATEAINKGEVVPVLTDWSFRPNYYGDAWILYPPTKHLPPKVRCFIDFISSVSQTI